MIDYFALLGQARRPWIDVEKLEDKYRELARATHPDQSPHSGDEFAELNKAYRTLRDPKSRLEHLLALQGESHPHPGADVPPDLAELFMKIAPVMQASDQHRISELLGQVAQSFDDAMHQLQALDNEWSAEESRLRAAKKLHQRLSFLSRWKDLLNERDTFI